MSVRPTAPRPCPTDLPNAQMLNQASRWNGLVYARLRNEVVGTAAKSVRDCANSGQKEVLRDNIDAVAVSITERKSLNVCIPSTV